MQEICINRLDISGSENDIKTFLRDFHSEERGFVMESLVPYDYNQSDTWRYSHWGTINDIFECSSYQEVINTFEDKNNVCKVVINYLTIQTPNEVFCKKVSKLYPKVKFVLTYYEPTQLFAGKSSYKQGYELIDENKYLEIEDEDKDDSIIRIYDFAIKENFTTLEELAEPLRRTSKNVQDYFYKKLDEEEDIVFDFNSLREEYMSENINIPKGDD